MTNLQPEPDFPPVQYYAYPPKQVAQYVCGVERMEDTLDELIPLHAAHWEETEKYLGEPMNVDYPRYIAMERKAGLVMFTVRAADNALAGYIVFTLCPHANVQHRLLASEASLFIHPDHRGKAVLYLLDYAEDCLRQLGVHYVTIGDKSPAGGAPLDKLLGRRGYSPFAITHIKILED